jgi:heterodisulfide reductase subunit A-like polyferredoxin
LGRSVTLDDAKLADKTLVIFSSVTAAGITPARKEAEDGLKLKMLEKEQTIEAMKGQVDELKRKAEQGSQQLQGEVQELELQNVLRAKFPRDSIEPVPKGEHCRALQVGRFRKLMA